MNAELLALANSELIDVNVKRLNGHIETADALRGWEREASAQMSLAVKHIAELRAALRLAAQSPEPVAWIDFADNGNVRLWTHKKARMSAEEAEGRKMTPVYAAPPQSAPVAVKPLEWSDAGEVIFQKWCAKTHFDTGYVLTKQFIGLKDPLYLIHHEDEFLGRFDDEATAKAAAQADYEQRIRSALVNAPMSASTTGRQALNEVVTNGEWTEGDQRGEWKISKAVYDLAVEARDSIPAASEATKSDGGEERPASNPLSEVTHRPSDPHEPATVLTKGGEGPAYIGRPGDARNLYEDSARDTRPADVTVDELAQLIIKTVETSAEGCSNGVWVNAHPAARALLDTYKIGVK